MKAIWTKRTKRYPSFPVADGWVTDGVAIFQDKAGLRPPFLAPVLHESMRQQLGAGKEQPAISILEAAKERNPRMFPLSFEQPTEADKGCPEGHFVVWKRSNTCLGDTRLGAIHPQYVELFGTSATGVAYHQHVIAFYAAKPDVSGKTPLLGCAMLHLL